MSRLLKKGIFLGKAAALLCVLLAFGTIDARAEAYSYTVTFYPGNHGSFQGTELVSVDNSASGSDYEISSVGNAIRVSGLCAGDVVGFDAAMEGAVELEEGSRYYVKGIRVSGRDNSTVDASAFRVEEDRDYVVAYGIRGDLTSYVVNYQDREGNTLAPSRTYYGNVGDKPRMAYLYIEGYQPQAYNLTKTLSKNAAENVFTFVYTRVSGGQTGGGNNGGGGTGGDTETPGGGTAPTVPGGAAPGQTGTVPNDNQGEAPNPNEGQNDDAQNPEDGQGGANQGEGGNQGESGNQDAGDLEGNEEPRQEEDLDDNDTPLGNYGGENGEGNGEGNGLSEFQFSMWASVVIAVTGAAAVIAALWVTIVTRKKTGAGKEKENKG